MLNNILSGRNRMGTWDYTGQVPYEPDLAKLRETEKLLYEILGKRSQGQDVGFDPARRQAQEALITSSLKRREQDQLESQLREAKGRQSAAGLSGNLRAGQASSGRIQSDINARTSEDLRNALLGISIEDLGAAREDKNLYSGMFQDFYGTNVNQQNKVADFDFNKDLAEEGFRQQNYNNDINYPLNVARTVASFFPGSSGQPIDPDTYEIGQEEAGTESQAPQQTSANALAQRYSGQGIGNVSQNPYGQNYSSVAALRGLKRRRVGGY